MPGTDRPAAGQADGDPPRSTSSAKSTITCTVPARVGLLGNPSDGYGGRTLGLAISTFSAEVQVEPADEVRIVGLAEDEPCWPSAADLAGWVDRHGYGTGPQLLAAAIRTLVDVAESIDHPGFDGRGFRLCYRTTIPRSVGLGGSSALVVAAIRALGQMIDLELPAPVLASVALRTETEQLGITAGLQDRVVQSMGGLVSMDFTETEIDARFGVEHGRYRSVDPGSLPPLFVAYCHDAAEPSDGYHRALRQRFESGDQMVRETLRQLAGLAVEGEAALRWNHVERFGRLLTENMRLRRLLGPLPEDQLALVAAAEAVGAPATFAGSGGAIVGLYDDEDHLATIRAALGAQRAEVDTAEPFVD